MVVENLEIAGTTTLCRARLVSTFLSANALLHAQVAGGKDESVAQPMWTPKNDLLFVSDRTGWWNIYKYVSPTQVGSFLTSFAILLLCANAIVLQCADAICCSVLMPFCCSVPLKLVGSSVCRPAYCPNRQSQHLAVKPETHNCDAYCIGCQLNSSRFQLLLMPKTSLGKRLGCMRADFPSHSEQYLT